MRVGRCINRLQRLSKQGLTQYTVMSKSKCQTHEAFLRLT